MDEPESNSRGIGIVGLIILILIGWWAWNHFFRTDYSKPWWTGTQRERVCQIGPGNCYVLPIVSDGNNVTQISFPNGGYATLLSSSCGKATSFNGRYCEAVDTEDRTWEVRRYE